MKSTVTFAGDVVAQVSIKDIPGLGITTERSYAATRSAASIESMSANYSSAINNYALTSVTFSVGSYTTTYTINKTVYDDGVVRFLLTPDSAANAGRSGRRYLPSWNQFRQRTERAHSGRPVQRRGT